MILRVLFHDRLSKTASWSRQWSLSLLLVPPDRSERSRKFSVAVKYISYEKLRGFEFESLEFKMFFWNQHPFRMDIILR